MGALANIGAGPLLAFVRFGAFFLAGPVPGSSVPSVVRLALAAGLAWAFAGSAHAAPTGAALYAAGATELVLGASMGLLLTFALQIFAFAGEAGGQQMGLATPGFVDPSLRTQLTVMGRAFSVIALTIFVLGDGVAHMLALLQRSLGAQKI